MSARRSLATAVVLLVSALLLALAPTPTSARATPASWSLLGAPALIDVPRSSGVTIDLVAARPGIQTLVLVVHDHRAARVRVVTLLGRVLAEGTTDGVVPKGTLAAGWRVFAWGSGTPGTRVWTPAFDTGRTLASIAPHLPCGTPTATAPLAGPFQITIPAGARPGGRTPPSPASALVFGSPAGGVRIATTDGGTLGSTAGRGSVARGGFAFAGAVFAYGTDDDRPVLWTPALTGTSTSLARTTFVACTPPAAGAFDGTATPVLAGGGTTATVGRDGGLLAAAGLTLRIPAGALREDVEITMTPLADMADSPLAGRLVAGARFAPEGLRFFRPARLTFALPGGVPPADVLGFASNGDGSDTHLTPRAVDGGSAAMDLWHFSTAGAATGGSEVAAQMSTHTPSAAESRALQRIAAAKPPCEAELNQQPPTSGGPGCIAFDGERQDALGDWYTEEIGPGLAAAVGRPQAQVEEALHDWAVWVAAVQDPFGLTSPNPMQAQLDAGLLAATDALRDLAGRALGSCTGGPSLAAQIRDVQAVIDLATLGDFDLAPLPVGLRSACASLKIEVLSFPPIAALLHANTVSGRVTLDVFTGPDRTDLPFTFTVDGRPVATGPDGSFQTTVTPISGPVNVPMLAEATDSSLRLETLERLTAPTRDRLDLDPLGPAGTGPGGSIPLKVRVAGDGMAGAVVALAVSGPGSVPPTATTDAAGEATVDYTAPQGGTTTQVTVTATLGDVSAATTLAVTVPVVVTVSPSAAILQSGTSAQFTATVTGAGNPAVVWSATGGTIDASGRYTAGGTPGSFAVTATSVADPNASASVPVTVEGAVLLSGTVTHVFDNGSFSAFVRAAVLPDGSLQILETTGGGTTTGQSDCGTNSIVTTVTGGRYLRAPNAYGPTLDVLEFRGNEVRTFTFTDENGECRTETTSEDDIPNVHAMRAVRVVENGQVVAIEFDSSVLGAPFVGQTGRLEPQ